MGTRGSAAASLGPVTTAAPRVRALPSTARGLAFVLFAVAFGTNVSTPLLLLYRERLDLSATSVTVIFAVYAAGLLPALFLAGPASDRLGRRPVVVPFVVVSVLASAMFLGASAGLWVLLLARLAQGMVSGAVFSVGSAWMGELVPDQGAASRAAATALSLGFGLGPLTAGVLAQWAPAPAITPFVVHLVLMAAALVVVRGVPETLLDPRGTGPLIDLGVPPAARQPFLRFVVPAALCVFTFPSVAAVTLPLRLQVAMPGIALAVTGAAAGLALTTGAFVQRLEKRLGPARAAPTGAAAGALGLSLGLVAAAVDAAWVLLPAATALGVGYGLTLAAGLTATQRLADPAARGALVSTFYAVAYLGFGAPVVISLVGEGTSFDNGLKGLLACTVAITILLSLRLDRATVDRPRPAVTPTS